MQETPLDWLRVHQSELYAKTNLELYVKFHIEVCSVHLFISTN